MTPRGTAPAAVGTLLALGLLAGCGGGRRDATVLEFWALGAEGEQARPLIAAFEAEHPGVRVRLQQIPWTAAHEKLLTAVVGDAAPDVAQIGNTWIPEFHALRALEPLDTLVARSAVVRPDAFFEGAWRTNFIGDTAWGIPWYVDTRVLFYRSDLLARAGYRAMPETWDEWRTAMTALRRVMGPGRYPLYLPTNEWNPQIILGMQAGSPLLKDDASYGAFRDAAFRRAFTFYLGLFRDSLAPPMGDRDVANVYQEFARGTFAMWITGPWNVGEFGRRLPDDLQDDWATAPLPGPDGPATGVSQAGGASLVVMRQTPPGRRVLAWQLVEFLSRAELQRRLYEVTGDLPARADVWEAGVTGLAVEPRMRAFWTQLHRVVPLPPVPESEAIMARVIEYSEQAVRGGVAADVVLARLDAAVDRMLEKRRYLLARAARARAQAAR